MGRPLLHVQDIKEFRVRPLSIITKLSTKINTRVFATIMGIAFCVTYLSGTNAMIDGLHDTTSNIFFFNDTATTEIYTDEDFALSNIGNENIPGNETGFIGFCFANVTLSEHGRFRENVYAVSLYDSFDILGLNLTNESIQTPVLMGTLLEDMLGEQSISATPGVTYTLSAGNNTAEVQVDALYPPGSIFPDDWLLVPRDVIETLRPEMIGNYSFLLLPDNSDAELLNMKGTSARPSSGVVGFFEGGIHQVESDLWTIILITGVMISLLVYCIMSIETEYNAPTIRILRGVGATRGYVIGLFILKACFITLIGGILGTALGFCVASGISSVASVLGIVTFVTPVATVNSAVIPVIIAVLSGLVGGFWPAVKASKMFTLRRNGQ